MKGFYLFLSLGFYDMEWTLPLYFEGTQAHMEMSRGLMPIKIIDFTIKVDTTALFSLQITTNTISILTTTSEIVLVSFVLLWQIPEINILRKGFFWLTILEFHCFSPWLVVSIVLGYIVKQHIMMEQSCSPHSQESKEKEEVTTVPQSPLSPSNLSPPTRFHLLKFLPPPNNTTLGTHRPLGNIPDLQDKHL